MTPVAATFDSASFTATHVGLLEIITTIAMVALNGFGVIAFAVVDVRTIVCLDTLHRHEGRVLHVPCGSSCLLLVVVEDLLLHHGVLNTDGIFALLHLGAPCDAARTIVQIILSLCFVGRHEREDCYDC